MEINGNIIIKAIAEKLNLDFNTSEKKYQIYKNQVIGELTKPCFFIHQLQVSMRKVRRNLYEFRFVMDVRYHTDTEITSINEELDSMGIKLLDSLETLNIENIKVRREYDNGYYEKQDNVLHVFANYIIKGTEEQKINYMKNLELNIKEDLER